MKSLKLSALFLVSLASLQAGVWAPVPMPTLQQNAELIVIASVTNIVSGTSGVQSIQLQVARTLQGNPPGLLVTAVLPPPVDPQFTFPNGVLTRDAIGQSGIWFLAQSAARYQVMPLIHGSYVTNLDIYVPLSGATLEEVPVQGTTNQQLLSYLVRSYIDIPNSCSSDDLVHASLLKSAPQDAMAALGPILLSKSPLCRVFGLATAIELGSDSAISSVAVDISNLAATRKFPRIIRAIKSYQPHGDSSIPVLKGLIGLNSGAVGIEGAVASALAKIDSRSVVPVMVTLLDSSEPEAVSRAATFFGFYTMFADSKGDLNVARNGTILGPLTNSDTKQYTPGLVWACLTAGILRAVLEIMVV